MEILIFIVVVVVCLAILIYGVQNLPVLGSPWREIIIACCCIGAVIIIANRAGLLHG